jgi:triosephosphate isomerase (TIM)
MSRKPIIAANWKMNLTPSQGEAFVKEFVPLVKNNQTVEMVLCPAAPTLERVIKTLSAQSQIQIGGQNIYFEAKGAFTGETSAEMLVDLKCKYVILGHSERRTLFHDTNETINKKVKQALSSGLHCIVCVGETLSQRESGKTENVVEDHIRNSLKDLTPEQMAKIVIAYEPVWAIGTGKTATSEQAQEVHAFIRKLLKEIFGSKTADETRIQYGGSVKTDNIKELMAMGDIDGALVGGASLKPDSFAQLVNYNN